MNCSLCRYNRYHDGDDVIKAGYVCTCERSDFFKKHIEIGGDKKAMCGQYRKSEWKNMPLKDALRTVTQPPGLFNNMFHHRLDTEDHPFIAMFFENNDAMEDWRDAHTRLFTEYMDMAKADGDFDDEEIKSDEQENRIEAEKYCSECIHCEVCSWYPYDGCEFRDLPTLSEKDYTELSERFGSEVEETVRDMMARKG